VVFLPDFVHLLEPGHDEYGVWRFKYAAQWFLLLCEQWTDSFQDSELSDGAGFGQFPFISITGESEILAGLLSEGDF
jgi:hypothetical protein